MKKIFAVIFAALTLAFAPACAHGSQNNSGTQDTSVAESKTKMFGSMQEYVDYPNREKTFDAFDNSTISNTCDFNCYAEDNAFVYEYRYKNQIPDSKLPVVKNSLSQNPESRNTFLAPMLEEIIECVDVENPVIIIRYSNSDGSVITEQRYDKSILEDNSQETTAQSSGQEL